jgi:hypothetical protein
LSYLNRGEGVVTDERLKGLEQFRAAWTAAQKQDDYYPVLEDICKAFPGMGFTEVLEYFAWKPTEVEREQALKNIAQAELAMWEEDGRKVS